MKHLFLCFFSTFFCGSICYGADLYVANQVSCDDSWLGNESQPWCTIQHAVDSAEAGDTIYVRAGTYPENVNINNSGSESGGYITLQNYQNDVVNISPGSVDGDDVSYFKLIGFHIIDPPSNNPGIDFGGSGGYIEIRNNEITGCNNNDQAALRFMGHLHHFYFDGNHVHHNRTGSQEAIRVAEHTSDFEITNNEVNHNTNIGIDVIGWEQYGKPVRGLIAHNISHDNSQTAEWSAGIYLDCASEMTIEYNISYGNYRGYEIGCEPNGDHAENNIMRYNISYENTQSGLHMGGYQGGIANDNEIYNNVFYNNGASEIGFDSTPGYDNHFYNNILYDPGTTLTSGGSGNTWEYNSFYGNSNVGSNNITSNPMFVDVDNYDFRLKEGSPAIDAGNPATPAGWDFAQAVVPTDGNDDGTVRADIGAYEHNGTFVPRQVASPVDFQKVPNLKQ